MYIWKKKYERRQSCENIKIVFHSRENIKSFISYLAVKSMHILNK